MDYKTAAKEIGKGNIKPVYLCYGPEKYLLSEFIHYLTGRMIDPEHRDFAISKFDMAETPVEAVIEDAETLPFMVPRKLIIAKDASFFTAAKDNGKIEHKLERLIDYMQSPVDYSVILFMVSADKLDERKKIVKTMKVKGEVVPFLSLTPGELINWVERQGERQQCTFAEGAVNQLITYAGTNLQTLCAEIEKLCLFVGDGGTITAEIVENMVVRTVEQNVFILIEEIARRRVDKAFSMYYELLKQKEEPVKIVLLIARQFRLMMQTKELSRQGYSQQQIASQLGMHPYAVKVAEEQSRKYDTKRLQAILAHLAELDYQMKSGKMEKVLGLELFLLKLAC